MDISLGWTRLDKDVMVYDLTGKELGKLFKTYGINILEIGNVFMKVWSPDLNKNVIIKISDLK